MAAIAVAILGVPALLAHGPLPRKPFDEQPVRLLKKARPQCVFLGDSMLDSRLNEAMLNRQAGQRCTVLAQPGTSTAMWYLLLKNVIAAQAHPPRTVVVFFRDRQLTLPAHRAEGSYRGRLETVMRGAEPLVDRLRERGRPAADAVDGAAGLDGVSRAGATRALAAAHADLGAGSRGEQPRLRSHPESGAGDFQHEEPATGRAAGFRGAGGRARRAERTPTPPSTISRPRWIGLSCLTWSRLPGPKGSNWSSSA